MGVLRDFYYGKIYPYEQLEIDQAEYQKIGEEAQKALTDYLEKHELKYDGDLERVLDANNRLHTITDEYAFEKGFQLGVQMLLEALESGDTSNFLSHFLKKGNKS